jgi:hypothetical protein
VRVCVGVCGCGCVCVWVCVSVHPDVLCCMFYGQYNPHVHGFTSRSIHPDSYSADRAHKRVSTAEDGHLTAGTCSSGYIYSALVGGLLHKVA